MTLVDTHCHLNFPDAFPEPARAIEEAKVAGVSWFIAIGCDLPSSLRAVELADEFKAVFAAVGIHPNYAGTFDAGTWAAIQDLASHPKVVAIGEVGLDYHWDFATPDSQRAAWEPQMDFAREVGLPVVLHCREAYGDLLDALESRPPQSIIFHCFSGGQSEADRALGLGGMFGFDGPITYKKAAESRAILAGLPRERVLLETDSPYLTPEPHRSKPNAPKYLPLVNAMAASVWGVSREEAAVITTANAKRVFGLPI